MFFFFDPSRLRRFNGQEVNNRNDVEERKLNLDTAQCLQVLWLRISIYIFNQLYHERHVRNFRSP